MPQLEIFETWIQKYEFFLHFTPKYQIRRKTQLHCEISLVCARTRISAYVYVCVCTCVCVSVCAYACKLVNLLVFPYIPK